MAVTTHAGPRRAVAPVAAGLALALGAGGWTVLAAWGASPWSRYLDHDGLAEASLPVGATVAVFVAGWLVMLAAMMLPTTYPLVAAFWTVVAQRSERRRLLALLLAGYATVWTLAGLVAYAGDTGLHALAEAAPVIEDNGWLIAAAVLAAAGAYQLSALKERCLTRCRDPRAVLLRGWHGRAPALESFTIGTGHGAACVSCCWALMLVLFALGAGSVGWMLAAGAMMATEKLAPWGDRLRQPIGLALLLGSAAIVVAHV